MSRRVARGGREAPDLRPGKGQPISIRLEAELIEDERKRAVVAQDVPKGSEWEILSDEGPGIGGDDSAPEPLTYLAAAVAFCHLTQMSQFARANRLQLDGLRIEQRWTYELSGSWRAGTREGRCTRLETAVEVESVEPAEKVRRMVAVGERACFAVQALAQPVPLRTTASLNGHPLPLGD